MVVAVAVCGGGGVVTAESYMREDRREGGGVRLGGFGGMGDSAARADSGGDLEGIGLWDVDMGAEKDRCRWRSRDGGGGEEWKQKGG